MKKAVILTVVLIVLVVGGIFGYNYWQQSRRFQTTDNAQVEGDVVQLSAEVPGRVVKLLVDDNQTVRKGQLLVKIDPSDYQRKVEQAERELSTLEARRRAAQEQVELTRQTGSAQVTQTASGVEAAQADVAAAQSAVGAAQQKVAEQRTLIPAAQAQVKRNQAQVEVQRTQLDRQLRDFRRYQTLYAKQEVSRQQLEQQEAAVREARSRLEAARREVDGAQAQVEQARASVATAQEGVAQAAAQTEAAQARVQEARGRLEGAEVAPQQVEVAQAQVGVLNAQIAAAKATLALARQDLARTSLYAPSDGRVTHKAVQAGTFLEKGKPVLQLVMPRTWVVANYKETQLEGMKAGLPVQVVVDAYPDHPLTGKIESIQPGTGARFSLFPPENAAGSFVKIVQRVPVRIALENTDLPLAPGMSAYVKVQVH